MNKFTVIGRTQKDHPKIIGVMSGIHPVWLEGWALEDYWVEYLEIEEDDYESAMRAAEDKRLAPIRPQIDAARAFREQFVDLWAGKLDDLGLSYQYGVREIADAIGERYMRVKNNMDTRVRHDDATRWWVIEKIINYCGGDVAHFRDLFTAAGGKITEKPWYDG